MSYVSVVCINNNLLGATDKLALMCLINDVNALPKAVVIQEIIKQYLCGNALQPLP